MFEGTLKLKGFDALARRNTARIRKGQDLRWLAGPFEDYILKDRVPKMFKHSGRVPGPYGKGFTKWAPNKPWVVRAKGFNKPLFSSRGPYGSGILKHFKFSRWSKRAFCARSARASFKLTNPLKYVKYLEAGYPQFRVPKSGKALLRIPYKPGVFIVRRYVYPGPMKARHITGFAPGDAKWLVRYAAKHALKVRI